MDWDTAVIIILVAAGGAIGAVLRYSVGHLVDSSTFPWSTFVVNFIGCTLIALIFFSYGHTMPELVRYFLFIGIFGAFTTMSTFTLETVTLFSDGQLSTAFLNWFMNAGVCLFGAFAGRYIALLF